MRTIRNLGTRGSDYHLGSSLNMYDNITMDGYMQLTPAQRKQVKKEKIQELLEAQLNKQNVPGVGVDELKVLISESVKEAIVELKDEINGFRREVDDLKEELRTVKDERNTMKKSYLRRATIFGDSKER